MIHWDWVATATVATPCILMALWLTARVGGAIEDAFDTWSNRRAIEREKAETRAKDARFRREWEAVQSSRPGSAAR